MPLNLYLLAIKKFFKISDRFAFPVCKNNFSNRSALKTLQPENAIHPVQFCQSQKLRSTTSSHQLRCVSKSCHANSLTRKSFFVNREFFTMASESGLHRKAHVYILYIFLFFFISFSLLLSFLSFFFFFCVAATVAYTVAVTVAATVAATQNNIP